MMYLRATGAFLAFFFFSFFGYAQDCTLDIGGKNTDVIIQIFQLNESQLEQIEVWGAELKIETKLIEDQIQKLFDEHPQSTPEELTTLADKYKVFQQKMVMASKEADKKLLSTFNTNQYDRYLTLCNEAFRRPIRVEPVVPLPQKDSIIDPE